MRRRGAVGWWVLVMLAAASVAQAQGADYPRIANLWGCWMPPGEAANWARYDLLVIGGGAAARWRDFAAQVRAINPDIVLLGTAPLMNISKPQQAPWMQRDWYLHRPDGSLVSWWADQVYAPNLSIDPCLDALLEETEKAAGELLRDGTVNGMFYDSVVGGATWYGEVDYDRDGKADDPKVVNPLWHARQNLFFDRLRERYPGIVIQANDVDFGHAPHVNGRLFEGGPLLDRMLTGTLAPADAIRTLDKWMATSVQPGLTFAIMTHPLGWQWWRVGKGGQVTTEGEVERARRDFRRMRLGLCAALMNDAYFAYDFGTVWYGLPWWYAEYEAPLGQPLGPAQEVFEAPPVTLLDWKAGDPADGLTLGIVAKWTPEGIVADEPSADSGWQRIFGTDCRTVTFEPGKAYRIQGTVEVLRKPGGSVQFNLRSPTGGWELHDKGVQNTPGDVGEVMEVDATLIPDDFADYSAEWHLCDGGAVRLTRLRVELVGQAYWRRDFEGGMALLNPLPQPITIRVPAGYARLRDGEAPRYAVEVDDESRGFMAAGAWERLGGEGHYAGVGWRQARKPGETATWTLVAPADDTYSVFALSPGGKELTQSAEYAVVSPAGGPRATVNQREGDGGLVKLFEVALKAGEKCLVELRSSGEGATVADLLHAESAARYNDGAAEEELTLGALDGVVLVRQ